MVENRYAATLYSNEKVLPTKKNHLATLFRARLSLKLHYIANTIPHFPSGSDVIINIVEPSFLFSLSADCWIQFLEMQSQIQINRNHFVFNLNRIRICRWRQTRLNSQIVKIDCVVALCHNVNQKIRNGKNNLCTETRNRIVFFPIHVAFPLL